MKNQFYTVIGTSLLTLTLAIAGPTMGAIAQDNAPTNTEETESSEQELNEAGNSFQEAGQETIEGFEETGDAIETGTEGAVQEASEAAGDAVQSAENAAQDAAQSAELAAERAETAAAETLDAIENRVDWGWLGLLGLLGLFGLMGGSKKREVYETRDPNLTEPRTTSTYSTRGQTDTYRQ